MSDSIKKILVYRTGSLGDSIMTLPCFHKIRKDFPLAYISLLTNKPGVSKAAPLEAILGSGYFFDEVINYPVGVRNPLELLSLLFKIRTSKFDLMINLTTTRLTNASALRDLWFFKATRIKRLVGFPTAKENVEIRIDPETGEQEWEAKRLARRLESFGVVPLGADASWDLRFTYDELAEAGKVLQSFSTRPIIAVCAGTKMQSKDWGRDNWLQLISTLKTNLTGWVLVMIGAPDESPIAEDCLQAWDGDGINLCGKTSPRVSGAVLKYAQVYVGHDSGPMHLAACVGTPCIAIFSSRNLPRQWYPRGNNNKVIYHKVDCGGCRLEVCIEQQKKCILSISVNEVQQALLGIINKQVTA
ncbi:glycosyltransferase family 9 protein [soil metagenome]